MNKDIYEATPYSEAGAVPVLESAKPSTATAVDPKNSALIQQAQIIPTSGDRKTTTRKEIYCYYLFYVGCTGIGPFTYGFAQLYNLLYLAGYDPDVSPIGQVPCGDGGCVLKWAGSVKPVASIVLDASGISFAAQALIFLTAGSTADYGNWRPLLCTVSTVISFGLGFAWLGVEDPSKWQASIVLTILGIVAFNLSFAYYEAAHPGLARDTPRIQQSEKDVLTGLKSAAEHAHEDEMERARIGILSNFVCDVGSVITLAIGVGIIKAIGANDSVAQNTKAYSVMIAYVTGVWIVCAIPWFIWEQKRPGLALPQGASYMTIGVKNLWVALREVWKLKQTLLWLLAYFLIGDSLNTSFSVIGILQQNVIAFNTAQFNYLAIATFASQGLGTFSIYFIQKKWGVTTRTIVLWISIFLCVQNLWGLIGVANINFGYKNLWEIWCFNVLSSALVSPWYQVSYNMIGDVVPRTKMFLFFSLFSIFGKTSAFVGPFITSAIIDRADGNVNMSFTFLLAVSVLGTIAVYFIDTEKSRLECKIYLEKEASELYQMTHSDIQQATNWNNVKVDADQKL